MIIKFDFVKTTSAKKHFNFIKLLYFNIGSPYMFAYIVCDAQYISV